DDRVSHIQGRTASGLLPPSGRRGLDHAPGRTDTRDLSRAAGAADRASRRGAAARERFHRSAIGTGRVRRHPAQAAARAGVRGSRTPRRGVLWNRSCTARRWTLKTRRRILALIVVAVAVAAGPALHAYLKLGYTLNGRLVGLEWTTAVPYRVTNRDITGVTAAQLQGTVAASFAEWARPANVQIGSQSLGFTSID